MIKDNKKKIKLSFLFLFTIALLVIFIPLPVRGAGISDWAGQVMGSVMSWIIAGLGMIITLVIKALITVAEYNDFIGAQAVKNGWYLVRNICNMFFVIILLLISVATILNQEKYSYKSWLPKIVLMSVLINYSKTICTVSATQ